VGERVSSSRPRKLGRPADVTEREQRILGIIETARAKRAKFRDERITMAHGAGGKATQSLIEGLLVPALGTGAGSLEAMADSGVVTIDGLGLALTTDSYVVRPIRFPGGSIGELAVNGTVNDLAAAGALPVAMTVSLVLEEGLPSDVLRAEVEAIAAAAREANVEVVAGDTKVVERGHADEMYICTAGLGRLDGRADLSPAGLAPGDRILLSGPVGDHGTAILLARGEFELDAPIESDTRPLWPVVDALLGAAGSAVHCLRDATRGGVASVLNELARASGVALLVREEAVPVEAAVAGAAEILGIDPMYVANEGKLVAFVAPEHADGALAAMRAVPGCERAAEIGEVRTEPPAMVLVETAFGGRRVMDQLVGDPLPRIC
jgi:hydrogenase expression/formation protein HypE